LHAVSVLNLDEQTQAKGGEGKAEERKQPPKEEGAKAENE